MRARIATALLTGVAFLTLIAGATSSSATPTATAEWTVTPGGNAVGTTSAFTLADLNTGNTIRCPDSFPVHLRPHWPNPYGTVTGLALSSCTSSLGLTFTLTANALPWNLNGTSFSAGVTTGTINGIDLTLSSSLCHAVVDGTSAGADNGQVTNTFTNSTDKMAILTTGSNLHFYSASGCLGLFANQDTATISASYTLSPAQTITSP